MRLPGATQVRGVKHKQFRFVLVIVVADKQPPTPRVTAYGRIRTREVLEQDGIGNPAVGGKGRHETIARTLGQGFGNAVDVAGVLNELRVGGVGGECKDVL